MAVQARIEQCARQFASAWAIGSRLSVSISAVRSVAFAMAAAAILTVIITSPFARNMVDREADVK